MRSLLVKTSFDLLLENMTTFRVKRLVSDATLPFRASKKAAGYDLSSVEDVTIPARGKSLIGTGLAFTVPDGTYGRIAPRSSLAWKNHIDVGGGVIDQDYLGEVKVVLFNHSNDEFKIAKGTRIAQVILEKIEYADVQEVEELTETERSTGGFGSTDK